MSTKNQSSLEHSVVYNSENYAPTTKDPNPAPNVHIIDPQIIEEIKQNEQREDQARSIEEVPDYNSQL